MDLDDEERMAQFIDKQIERAEAEQPMDEVSVEGGEGREGGRGVWREKGEETKGCVEGVGRGRKRRLCKEGEGRVKERGREGEWEKAV